jgi:hypothetical protein
MQFIAIMDDVLGSNHKVLNTDTSGFPINIGPLFAARQLPGNFIYDSSYERVWRPGAIMSIRWSPTQKLRLSIGFYNDLDETTEAINPALCAEISKWALSRISSHSGSRYINWGPSNNNTVSGTVPSFSSVMSWCETTTELYIQGISP